MQYTLNERNYFLRVLVNSIRRMNMKIKKTYIRKCIYFFTYIFSIIHISTNNVISMCNTYAMKDFKVVNAHNERDI